MWKIIISLALVGVVQSDMQKFFGEWTPVMMYPKEVGVDPVCEKYSAYGDANVKCTCADGKNITYVIFEKKQYLGSNDSDNQSIVPMLEVTNIADVEPLGNVSCTCGGKTYEARYIARFIRKDYLVIYDPLGFSTFTSLRPERYLAYVVARNVDNSEVIDSVINSDSDLKGRVGGKIFWKELANNL